MDYHFDLELEENTKVLGEIIVVMMGQERLYSRGRKALFCKCGRMQPYREFVDPLWVRRQVDVRTRVRGKRISHLRGSQSLKIRFPQISRGAVRFERTVQICRGVSRICTIVIRYFWSCPMASEVGSRRLSAAISRGRHSASTPQSYRPRFLLKRRNMNVCVSLLLLFRKLLSA